MTFQAIRKLRIQTQLTRTQTILEKLYSLLAEQSGSGVISYSFSSGEGEQRTVRRSLKDVMDEIERLEASEASLINDLYNCGLISVALRRKTPQ